MSTILEALKKSERDRNIGAVPEIKTLHIEPIKPATKPSILVLLLGLILGVNVLLGGIWLVQVLLKSADDAASSTQGQQPVNVVQAPDTAQAIIEPLPAAAAVQPVIQQQPVIAQPPSKQFITASGASVDPADLRELPTFYKKQLPALDFQSHMFSSEPKFRSVMINGISYREGDFLHDRCQITAITQAGLVVRWEGKPYTLTIAFAH